MAYDDEEVVADSEEEREIIPVLVPRPRPKPKAKVKATPDTSVIESASGLPYTAKDSIQTASTSCHASHLPTEIIEIEETPPRPKRGSRESIQTSPTQGSAIPIATYASTTLPPSSFAPTFHIDLDLHDNANELLPIAVLHQSRSSSPDSLFDTPSTSKARGAQKRKKRARLDDDEEEDSRRMPPPAPPLFFASSSPPSASFPAPPPYVPTPSLKKTSNKGKEKEKVLSSSAPTKKRKKSKQDDEAGYGGECDEDELDQLSSSRGVDMDDEVFGAKQTKAKAISASKELKKDKTRVKKSDKPSVPVAEPQSKTKKKEKTQTFKSAEFIPSDEDDDPIIIAPFPVTVDPPSNPDPTSPTTKSFSPAPDSDGEVEIVSISPPTSHSLAKKKKSTEDPVLTASKRKAVPPSSDEDEFNAGEGSPPPAKKKKLERKKKTKKVILSDEGEADSAIDEEPRVPSTKPGKSKAKGKEKGKAKANSKDKEKTKDTEEGEHGAKENLPPAPPPEEEEEPPAAPPQSRYPPPSTSVANQTPQPQTKPQPRDTAYKLPFRNKSTPMSELIKRVNSMPGSPFASPATPASAISRKSSLKASTGTYSPLMKASRSLLTQIAPLHPNRRPPPPVPPRAPAPKKTKKELEREEAVYEELCDDAGMESAGLGVGVWEDMEEVERRRLVRSVIRRREEEGGGWD